MVRAMSPDLIALLTVTINGLIAIALAYLGYKSSEAARVRRENGKTMNSTKDMTAGLPDDIKILIDKQRDRFLSDAVKAAHELTKSRGQST